MTPGALPFLRDAFATALWRLHVGRLLVGLGAGASSTLAPLCLAGTAPAETRGAMVWPSGTGRRIGAVFDDVGAALSRERRTAGRPAPAAGCRG